MTPRQIIHLVKDAVAGKPLKKRSAHWPTVRKAWLAVHPTCAACGTSESCEVHHIQSFHEHPERELDDTNFITLCDGPHRCHHRVGHVYDWKWNNVAVVADAAVEWLRIVEREKYQAPP